MTSSVMTRMPAPVGLADEQAEVLARAVAGVDAVVVGDVVAVVAQRRRVERQEPEAGDAQVLEVVELLDQAGEVAHPVVVAVEERLDVQLIDDGIFVPERVGFDHGRNVSRSCDAVVVTRPASRRGESRSESLPLP